MKIKIVRPDPDYPLAWVFLDVEYKKTDANRLGVDLAVVLGNHHISIIGSLETVSTEGLIVTMKAPALLESEHTMLPRRRTRKK